MKSKYLQNRTEEKIAIKKAIVTQIYSCRL